MGKSFGVALLALVSGVAAQAGMKKLYGDFYVSIKVDPADDKRAEIKLRMQKDTWMGLALGSSGMAVNTDMIQVDGTNKKVYDKTSSGY